MSYKLLAGGTITKDKSGDITVNIDKPLVSISGKKWNSPDQMGHDIYDAVYKTFAELYKEVRDFAEEATHPKDAAHGRSNLLIPTGKEDAHHHRTYKINPYAGNSSHSKLKKAIGSDGFLTIGDYVKKVADEMKRRNKAEKSVSKNDKNPEKNKVKPAPVSSTQKATGKQDAANQPAPEYYNPDDDNTSEGGFGANDKAGHRRFIFQPQTDNGTYSDDGGGQNTTAATNANQAPLPPAKPQTGQTKRVKDLTKQATANADNPLQATTQQTDKKAGKIAKAAAIKKADETKKIERKQNTKKTVKKIPIKRTKQKNPADVEIEENDKRPKAPPDPSNNVKDKKLPKIVKTPDGELLILPGEAKILYFKDLGVNRLFDNEVMGFTIGTKSYFEKLDKSLKFSGYNLVGSPSVVYNYGGTGADAILSRGETLMGTPYEFGGRHPISDDIGLLLFPKGENYWETIMNPDLSVISRVRNNTPEKGENWNSIYKIYKGYGLTYNEGPSLGIDCSGFAGYCYGADDELMIDGKILAGKTSEEQYEYFKKEARKNNAVVFENKTNHLYFNFLSKGDLIFFREKRRHNNVGHVAIATGEVIKDEKGNIIEYETIEAHDTDNGVIHFWRKASDGGILAHPFRQDDVKNGKFEYGKSVFDDIFEVLRELGTIKMNQNLTVLKSHEQVTLRNLHKSNSAIKKSDKKTVKKNNKKSNSKTNTKRNAKK